MSATEMSNRGLANLLGEEGIVLKPYLDGVGVWTIAGGHTHMAGPPDPRSMPRNVEMPLTEALALFKHDVGKYTKRVLDAVRVPLEQHELDALVSFDYNTGGIHRARLTTSLNAGNRAAAADGFMGWIRPRSIVPRRTREMRMFEDGIYSDRKVPVWGTNGAGRLRGVDRTYTAGEIVNMLSSGAETPVEGGWPRLMRGSRGPEVEALQTLLGARGYRLLADGDFGSATERDLIAFQKALVQYGVTGAVTWIALGAEQKEKTDA